MWIPFTELDRNGDQGIYCLKETFSLEKDSLVQPGQVVVNADTDENGWQYAFVVASAHEDAENGCVMMFRKSRN